MGLFGTKKEEIERLRGIRDVELPSLSDTRLILLTLAALCEAQGSDDLVLVDELYRRARGFPGSRRQ
jgi:hypothetical protein